MFKTFELNARLTSEFCTKGIKIKPNDSMVVVKNEKLLCLFKRTEALNLHLAVTRMLFKSFSAGSSIFFSIGPRLNTHEKKVAPALLMLFKHMKFFLTELIEC
jgi:hypothetical protein